MSNLPIFCLLYGNYISW